jgi:small multidrug resistance family-3 protein
MNIAKTLGLFVVTAVCEIVGCYLPYLWLREDRTPWLLAPAAASLALFAWLLTLHPDAAGRTYASYGGVYVTVAIAWLWLVNGQRPDRWDIAGSVITVVGMAVIAFAPHAAKNP